MPLHLRATTTSPSIPRNYLVSLSLSLSLSLCVCVFAHTFSLCLYRYLCTSVLTTDPIRRRVHRRQSNDPWFINDFFISRGIINLHVFPFFFFFFFPLRIALIDRFLNWTTHVIEGAPKCNDSSFRSFVVYNTYITYITYILCITLSPVRKFRAR